MALADPELAKVLLSARPFRAVNRCPPVTLAPTVPRASIHGLAERLEDRRQTESLSAGMGPHPCFRAAAGPLGWAGFETVRHDNSALAPDLLGAIGCEFERGHEVKVRAVASDERRRSRALGGQLIAILTPRRLSWHRCLR